MKYFKSSFKFKKDESGKTVFYPWGTLGKGYIFPDEKTEERLRGFERIYAMVSLPLSIAVIAIAGLIYSIPLLLILTVWYQFKVKALIGGFPISDRKLTIKESTADTAKSYSKITLWLFFVCCLLFATFGLLALINAISNNGPVMHALLLFLLFGAGALAFAYMIKAKRT